MRVKVKRGLVGQYGRVRRGQVVDLPTREAQQLVRRGLASEVTMADLGERPARRRIRKRGA